MSSSYSDSNLFLPPQDKSAEEACLGSCLVDPEAFDKVSEIISGAEDFYHRAHQEIYLAMVKLNEQNDAVDVLTVGQYLKSCNKLEYCGGWLYLNELIERVGRAANVKTYAKIVADNALLRRLLQAGKSVSELVDDPDISVKDKIDRAEELVLGVSRNTSSTLVPLSDIAGNTFDLVFKMCQDGGSLSGLPSGFSELDDITTGFHPSNLIIIGARPSMGKTAFALSIALNVALNKERPGHVAVFSLEMSAEDLCMRMMCSLAEINGQGVRSGKLSSLDISRLSQVCAKLNDAPIYIDDRGGNTVLEIKAKLRRMKKRTGLDLVIIDYLQLIRGSSSRRAENRVNEISEISRQLKSLSKELNVPIIALSQVSRQVENRQDKRPTLADLRESGAIEQDADLVAFLYRDEYYNKQAADNTDIAEVIIAKHRNGPIGTVKLRFIKKYGGFYNRGAAADKSSEYLNAKEQTYSAASEENADDAVPMPVKKQEQPSFAEEISLDGMGDMPF